MSRAAELIGRGQEALREGEWASAQTAFEAAVALEATPEALDGLGQALYWQHNYSAATEYRERAYAGFRTRGEDRSAALIACWLAYMYGLVYGNFAACSGWAGRARSLIEAADDGPEHGWVALTLALLSNDPDERERHVTEAMAVAKRFHDADLEFDALSFLGWSLLERGRIEEGMARLDEAVAAATSGEVQDFNAISDIYCKMLFACELVLDVRRAEQWMAVAQQFVRRSNGLPVSAIYCRTYYCGVMAAGGRWSEAESELETTVRTFEDAYQGIRSGALVRLADLRVRQGRHEEAAQLLAGHEQDPYAVPDGSRASSPRRARSRCCGASPAPRSIRTGHPPSSRPRSSRRGRGGGGTLGWRSADLRAS